jgi:hypothetical protein
MATLVASARLSELSRRVIRLQVMTIAWMTVEAVVSLGTAWRSHSPALLAFGGDSLIELLSAAVVFWRFRFDLKEARASRMAGVLLFVLAGLVILTSVLNFIGYREAQRSLMGIGILLAAVVMPWLQTKAPLGNYYSEHRIDGGCSSVRFVCLHVLDSSGGSTCQLYMGSQLGRSRRSFGSYSTHSAGRMDSRSDVKIELRLLLNLSRARVPAVTLQGQWVQ